MDTQHPRRPRQSSPEGYKKQPDSQRAAHYSAAFATPVVSSLPAYLQNSAVGFDMPGDAPVKSAKKLINESAARAVDFSVGAKAYKYHTLGKRVYHALFAMTVILLVAVALLGGIGVYLNAKYTGRALPLAKIGNLSVGGMDRAQIERLLSDTSKNLTVTFVDGGLSWEVPVSSFNPDYDFKAAIDQTLAHRFNPYTFLLKTQTNVKAGVNERHVAGYLRQNITYMQTRSEDAYIIKGSDSVVAKPEVLGFSANPVFVSEQINKALSSLTDTRIKMNAAGVKPNVYTADLQPEITRANNMLNTNVSVRYAGINATPTKKQKLEWLTINPVPNSNYYNFDFSKAKIREYVVGLAQKYQKPVKIEQPSNQENPAGYTVPTVVINNIEEVTNQLYQGMKNGQSTVAVFTKDNSVRRVIPLTEVAGATTTRPSNSTAASTTSQTNLRGQN